MTQKLRALMAHRYADRMLRPGDVYVPESPLHVRLLVAAGRATLVDESVPDEPILGSEAREELRVPSIPDAVVVAELAEIRDQPHNKRRGRRRRKAHKSDENA